MMLYFHGGGLMTGANSEQSMNGFVTQFARHNIVAASANYRLGPLGGILCPLC